MESIPPEWTEAMDKAVEDATRALFAGGEPTDAMLRETSDLLAGKVMESFAGVVDDFTVEDTAMLARLSRDTFHFSAAKNWQQLRDMRDALVGDDGKARTLPEYRRAVESMNLKYNRNWIKTEYNNAMSSSQNAARWAEFEKDAEDFPNLVYQTVGDDNVRESHRILDGIVRPVTDPFWDARYPPNGWGCRCEALQDLSGNVTPYRDLPKVNPVAPMFRTNLAKNGLVFPPGHPYYPKLSILH